VPPESRAVGRARWGGAEGGRRKEKEGTGCRR
jgi:hypothetical protein